MTITIHKDDGSGWGVRDGAGKPVLPEQHHCGLAGMRPETREAVLKAAERHRYNFLTRLQARALRDGPDGEVIRTDFDLIVLGVLIDVLREAEELP